MKEELKACPFCGGRSHHTMGARQIRMLDVMKCLDCFAEIQGTYEPESAMSKWNARAQLPSQGGEAVEAECRRLQRLVKMLVRQHMPLEPVDGLDGWSEVISARKAIELRDAALTECERLREALHRARKAESRPEFVQIIDAALSAKP